MQPSDPTEGMSSKVVSSFNNDLIKEVLKTHFFNTKTKISEDAVELMSELMNTLVIEGALRAAKQCSSENKKVVTLDHIEGVLPQIMLDFS